MSGAHALAAPSGMHVLMACAASMMAQAAVAELPPTEDTLNGEAAHWGGAELIAEHPICKGQVTPNGTVLTDEMIESAEQYADFFRHRVQMLREQGDPLPFMAVEKSIPIPDIHTEHCFGTPDAWIYSAKLGVIEVFDFKFGHRYVDEFENWQLIAYTSGLLSAIGVNGIDDRRMRVRLHVIQPRCYQATGVCRTWNCLAVDLRAFINTIRNQVDRALQPNAVATPNEHCIDCKARHTCRALQLDAYRSAQIADRSLPLNMDAPAVGLELKFLRDAALKLKARIDGLEQQAQAMFTRGESVPFSKMVPSLGRQMWSKPIEEVVSMGRLCGIDIAKPDAITPKQAIDKGMPEEIVNMYSKTNSRGLKIAADDGKEARKIFYINR